jgi:dsDNA-specific endonuclease/ATPase MutS2
MQDTLRMLEWARLCQHVSKHTSTGLGKKRALKLSVPLQEATSLRLQAETQ